MFRIAPTRACPSPEAGVLSLVTRTKREKTTEFEAIQDGSDPKSRPREIGIRRQLI